MAWGRGEKRSLAAVPSGRLVITRQEGENGLKGAAPEESGGALLQKVRRFPTVLEAKQR